MKYKKISQDHVFNILAGVAADALNPIQAMNIKDIMYSLNTSRYQVKKHMDNLKKNGLVELKCFNISPDDEIYPPYWGYQLTEKAKQTKAFEIIEKKSDEIFKDCFGI